MKEGDHKQTFIDFLTQYNVLDIFKHNLKVVKNKSIDEFLDSFQGRRYGYANEYINYAFSWNQTNKSCAFWESLDLRWRNFLAESSKMTVTINEPDMDFEEEIYESQRRRQLDSYYEDEDDDYEDEEEEDDEYYDEDEDY